MHAALCNSLLAMTVQATSSKTPFAAAVESDGRSRLQLAAAMGIDPVTLWRWMKKQTPPRSELSRRSIEQTLGRQIEELWP